MTRTLPFWLLALTLLFGQYAGQLHALSHLKQELLSAGALGDKAPPPSDHSAEVCVAFHAVDSILPSTAPVVVPMRVEVSQAARVLLPLARPAPVPFLSRAPPDSLLA